MYVQSLSSLPVSSFRWSRSSMRSSQRPQLGVSIAFLFCPLGDFLHAAGRIFHQTVFGHGTGVRLRAVFGFAFHLAHPGSTGTNPLCNDGQMISVEPDKERAVAGKVLFWQDCWPK